MILLRARSPLNLFCPQVIILIKVTGNGVLDKNLYEPGRGKTDIMTIDKKILLKKVLPVMLGALAGYAYYYFIGCKSGSCPIQGNPYISTLYGALAGGIFAIPGKEKQM